MWIKVNMSESDFWKIKNALKSWSTIKWTMKSWTKPSWWNNSNTEKIKIKIWDKYMLT